MELTGLSLGLPGKTFIVQVSLKVSTYNLKDKKAQLVFINRVLAM
jgi:hypothetical protein